MAYYEQITFTLQEIATSHQFTLAQQLKIEKNHFLS